MDERYLDYLQEALADHYFDWCDLHGLDADSDEARDLYRDHLNS